MYSFKDITTKGRLFIALIIFFGVILFGIAGFKTFGGPQISILDSLYMAVITLSTVGYKEVVDLSQNPALKMFTIVYIVSCLGTIAYAVSSITAFIMEGELKNLFGRRKMQEEISKLQDHYIICGADETARTIAQELLLTKRKFILVEESKEKIDKLSHLGKLLFIQDDPSEEEVLISAGIEKAQGILLCLPTDEQNLFMVITARSLNPKIRVVAEGANPKTHKKMSKVGADAVVSPSFIGGMRMVSEMVRPAVVSFLDMMLKDRKNVLRVEEVTVKPDSSLMGKKVSEARIKQRCGALLVGIRKKDSPEYEFNPPADYLIKDKDILVVMIEAGNMSKLKSLAEKS